MSATRRRPGDGPGVELSEPSGAADRGPQAPILELERLNRRFGAKHVVESLSVSVKRGERVALWGENGSGKTTVLRCVAGTLTPTGGSISIAGFAAGSRQARQLLGTSLGQERSFYLRLSGHANLLFFARMRHRTEREAARAVESLEDELELSAIAAERGDRCSAGMLQQLALARALLGDPPLLLLDEPTRSLDRSAVGRLWGALDRRPGTALVIATHNPEDIEHCEARIDLPA